MKRIECEGVGDNDGFFEAGGASADPSREELVHERDILEREYKKAMRCICEFSTDISKIRKRVLAIKDAARYRNMGGISTLRLLSDIEKIAQNALDEPPTDLGG